MGNKPTICVESFRVFTCQCNTILLHFSSHRHNECPSTSHRLCVYIITCLCAKVTAIQPRGIIDFVQEVRATANHHHRYHTNAHIRARERRIVKRKSELQMIIRYPFPERARRRSDIIALLCARWLGTRDV